MRELKLARGYVVYPGKERYSLGSGIVALPAAPTLREPAGLKQF